LQKKNRWEGTKTLEVSPKTFLLCNWCLKSMLGDIWVVSLLGGACGWGVVPHNFWVFGLKKQPKKTNETGGGPIREGIRGESKLTSWNQRCEKKTKKTGGT